jgi:casein kinase II subunit beta
MSRKENRVAASRWIAKYLGGLDHHFYSAVPEKFYLDSLIVSHLNRHFDDNDMKYFKTCFKVLTGTPCQIPTAAASEINSSVKLMHDLVHGRFIVSEDGLETVYQKHVKGMYGKCPRLHCEENFLLPLGLHDLPGLSSTQCFCSKCRDVYQSSSHVNVDSVVFGTSLPHLFLQQYPDMCPTKPEKFYVPKIYGFKIHSLAPELCKYYDDDNDDNNDQRGQG